MTSLWLLVAGYFALVVGLLIAFVFAPEGHEDDHGFRLRKPQTDDEGAGEAAVEGSMTGLENTLATKGDE